MTRIVRLRRITLHFSHIGLTLGRTFIGSYLFIVWVTLGESGVSEDSGSWRARSFARGGGSALGTDRGRRTVWPALAVSAGFLVVTCTGR